MPENAPSCIRRFFAAQAVLRSRRPNNELFCFAEAFEECAIALRLLGAVRLYDSGADHALGVERAAVEEAIDRILRFLGSSAGQRYLKSISLTGNAA